MADIHLDFAPQCVDPHQNERIDLGQHCRESTIGLIGVAKCRYFRDLTRTVYRESLPGIIPPWC
jgi:hypothetical protein